jgi:hypothetical protein
MLLTSTPLLRLSQGQLNLLATCPRKFQHTYLEQLAAPADPKQNTRQILGSRFHLLMQQQAMGLPIQNFLAEDAQLNSWMTAFAHAAPDILAPASEEEIFRESEHSRTLQILTKSGQDFLFTVIYDLMIADRQFVQILDWKTYPQPPNPQNLANNWQTKLYMYVLAETSEYTPENISMTYWFVQSPEQPMSIKFAYDRIQHNKIAAELNTLLSNLTTWLQAYHADQPFPQISDYVKICPHCQFVTICERQRIKESIPDLAEIPEVSLEL